MLLDKVLQLAEEDLRPPTQKRWVTKMPRNLTIAPKMSHADLKGKPGVESLACGQDMSCLHCSCSTTWSPPLQVNAYVAIWLPLQQNPAEHELCEAGTMASLVWHTLATGMVHLSRLPHQ